CCFFFSSRRRHTRSYGDWSSDVCSSDLMLTEAEARQCLTFGAVNYLGKPIVLEHLRDILACLEPLAEPGAPASPARVPERRIARSEERRVGKEWRSRGAPGQ